MTTSPSALHDLLGAVLGQGPAATLIDLVDVHPQLLGDERGRIHRSVIAEAMNLLLFQALLERVPEAATYVSDKVKAGGKVVFDHGALRTVDGPLTGALPSGEAAITRILKPLGYEQAGLYPLDRLKMTGRAYVQADLAEHIPQFFVSELHVDRFSPAFQDAVGRITGTSLDPLPAAAQPWLDELSAKGSLGAGEAAMLLPMLAACFDRQHTVPSLADYDVLLGESAEMAWIATEGNAFNHATDRVGDLESEAQAQKDLGRPMKDAIEVSSEGTVRQTAYKATRVVRAFTDAGGALVFKEVPGSFYEFIERRPRGEGDNAPLDLRFDSSNAQGIFKMTSADGQPASA